MTRISRMKQLLLTTILLSYTLLRAATLHIQPDVQLELKAGPHSISQIDRTRYFRSYHIPGMYSDERAKQLKVLAPPARGTGPYFGHNAGDDQRPGWAPQLTDQYQNYADFYAEAAKRYPDAIHAMAGGNYPETDQVKTDKKKSEVDSSMATKHRKGIQREDYEASINLVCDWLTYIKEAGSIPPKYYSPINEPDACWKNTPKPPKDHARFARQMALQLKEKHPDVKLSGPSTAWSHPRINLKRWMKSSWERQFIESVGDIAGAYDFHFYSKELWAKPVPTNTNSRWQTSKTPNMYAMLQQGNPFVWDFGKADAYLDLIYSHHQNTWGKPSLPVIVSEFGRQGITPQKGPWNSDYLYYLFGTTITRMWMQFMDRPEVELTVPFILPESDPGYAQQRGQAMYNRPDWPESSELKKTPLLDFYSFFKGIKGKRVAIDWEDIDYSKQNGLYSIAVRTEDKLQIIVHNSFIDELDLSLNIDGKTSPAHGMIARMRWEGTVPSVYTDKTTGHWRMDQSAKEIVDLSSMTLAGEETAIISIGLKTEQCRKRLTKERFYAGSTIQKLYDKPTSFSIELPQQSSIDTATLVATLSSNLGFKDKTTIQVEINGHKELIDLGFTTGMKSIFMPIRVKVPTEKLHGGSNSVTFSVVNGLTNSSTHIATARLDIGSVTRLRKRSFWEFLKFW